LPEKIQAGRINDIRECIGCNICYAADSRGVPIRCTQNPTMGEEWRRAWHPEKIAAMQSDNTILVVGAGPAGLEAARSLGQRGYKVTLAEATKELGGRVAAECRLPGLTEWRRVIEYRIQQIKRMRNIDVYLDSPLSVSEVLGFGFNRIIVATGSRWRREGVARWHVSPVKEFKSKKIFTPDDILADIEVRGPVVLYDDDHYYMGSVLAEALVGQGAEVCFVTPENLVSAWGVMTDEQYQTQQHLIQLGVEIITAHGLDEFDGSRARLSCVYTERTRVLEADAVVLVTARIPNDGLYREIAGKIESDTSGSAPAPTLNKIGDCDAPAIIAAAVYAGHRYARELETDTEQSNLVRQDKLFDPD